MLVCNVSLRPPRRSIVADLAEAATAADQPGTGNVVFATLVDDPANVLDVIDAYLGEIMLEAASASDTVDSGLAFAASVIEAATGGDAIDATIGVSFTPATINGALINFTTAGAGLIAKRNSNLAGGAASASFKSSGKYYFEMKPTVWAGALRAGIIVSTASVDASAGDGNTCVVFGAGSTIVWTNGTSTAKNLGVTAVNDLFGVAIDLGARLAWFRRAGGNWNGDAAADPATGAGGVLIVSGSFAPWAAGQGASGNVDEVTYNFGQSAFTGAVPSGFTAGWPV